VIVTITLNVPDFEEQPDELPRLLRQLADTLEGDTEPDINAMDGSLNITDTDGTPVGNATFDWE